jgi:hypothetical protein
MGKIIQRNTTIYNRCPKNELFPFIRVPANLLKLNGYQQAIMTQIISNKDGWNLVKYEISRRLGFPRNKFNKAWKSLEDLGYIKKDRIQGGWEYKIIEDLNFTSTTGGICEDSTLTTGALCEGGILTTINNNYYSNSTTGRNATYYLSQFKELMECYPSIGTRPDGTTYKLKGKPDDCKKAYIDYLKTNVMSHDEIITALKVELNDKRMTGETHYQSGLFRWIKDKVFENFKDRTIEPAALQYGTELI